MEFKENNEMNNLKIDAKDLSYRYNCNGYEITYKGKDIGGAGVKNMHKKPHWKQKIILEREYRTHAINAMEDIMHGKPEWMMKNIRKIQQGGNNDTE